MRMIAVLFLLFASALPSAAISRYHSPSLSCDEIKSRIADERAVILRYPGKRNPALTVYDRYVASASMCDSHQTTERMSIPASDTDRCRVLHCVTAPDRCDGVSGGPGCRKLFR